MNVRSCMKGWARFSLPLWLLVFGPKAWADGDPRALVVKLIHPSPSFQVRVDVNHASRMYRRGDTLTVTVKSEKAGHLYLFYCDAAKNVSCLFPNEFQKDNRVPAGKLITVPDTNANFTLDVTPPFGKEVLSAVVTQRPLSAPGLKEATKNVVTQIAPCNFKGIYSKALERKTGVAEHHVEIFTHDPTNVPKAVKDFDRGLRRRIGLCIGIDRYKDRRIPALSVAANNAREMATVLKKRCGFDRVQVLTNEQATLSKIKQAILDQLVKETRVEDTVLVYWSGHGNHCDDDDKDETDGTDEYLIPHDGVFALEQLRQTMLIDDMFGRWLQALDGRKIILILDACNSGGQIKGARSLPTDFFDSEISRARDIGQRQTVVLASSRPAERSLQLPRREKKALSVMTYFLLQKLATGKEALTTKDVFQHLRREVPNYVRKKYAARFRQTPIMLPENDRTVLRPAVER